MSVEEVYAMGKPWVSQEDKRHCRSQLSRYVSMVRLRGKICFVGAHTTQFELVLLLLPTAFDTKGDRWLRQSI